MIVGMLPSLLGRGQSFKTATLAGISATEWRDRRRHASVFALGIATLTILRSFAPGGEPLGESEIVRGRVLAPSGLAVGGARVRVDSPQGAITGQCDSSGRFKLTVPKNPLGNVPIIASDSVNRLGLGQTRGECNWQQPPDVPITLSETILLDFSVTDRDGRPVPDAQVGALINQVGLPAQKTDALGQTSLRVPRYSYPTIHAYKRGHGFGYHMLDLGAPSAQGLPKTVDSRLTLKLDAAGETVSIRAKAEDAQPIAGLAVRLWRLQRLDLSAMPEAYAVKTNAQGIASFDDLPSWSKGLLSFSIDADNLVPQQFSVVPAKVHDGVFDVVVPHLVEMSGRVEFANGTPAPGIAVEVWGRGHFSSCVHRSTKSRPDGSFAISVYPEANYVVGIDDPKWAAKSLLGIPVWPLKPVQNLKLTLEPGTRVHGRLVAGRDRSPVADQYLSLARLPSKTVRPQGGEAGKAVTPPPLPYGLPTEYRSTRTDRDGRYEFRLQPGRYMLTGAPHVPVKQFEVTNKAEMVFDLEAPRLETGPIAGTVIAADTGRPVPHARVSGGDLTLLADDSGRFLGERKSTRLTLFGISPDEKMAGLLDIGPDDSSVTITLRAMGKAAGQIVSATGSAPLANVTVCYKASVAHYRSWVTSSGETMTDGKGNFELKSLVPGVEYGISARAGKTGERPVGFVTIDQFDAAKCTQLGPLVLYDPPRPNSLEEDRKIASVGLHSRYLEAQAEAQLNRRRLALFFVDPKSPETRTLSRMFVIGRSVYNAMGEYSRILIDAKSESGKAFAKSLNLAPTVGNELPRLVIRDAQGGPVAVYEASEISVDGNLDASRLADVLRANANQPLDAQSLLDGALAQAHQSNRRVLVVDSGTAYIGSPWLSRYLQATKPIWDKDYIFVRIDARWKNSDAVVELIQSGATRRVFPPWMAILDSKANVLVTSAQVGTLFPPSLEGSEQFIKMFKDTAQRLSAEDFWKLRIAIDAVPLH
jgi:hypothetical protein